MSLAARQRARELRAPLGEPREPAVDVVERGRDRAVASPREAAEQQIVRDAHRREQLALLRHQHDAARDALLDRPLHRARAEAAQRAMRRQKTRDRPE